ncbi:hypothetical protein EVAR_26464_1 [Eumeta japonica]|uniref:Uncharacterized protein n=1 Tax=Eumeta variegata TaxID=151549 RepID=A0A4C1YZQ1_EUMVA|nr:hypothetical protein EVAR_26464_1 [Eumeta japonica]
MKGDGAILGVDKEHRSRTVSVRNSSCYDSHRRLEGLPREDTATLEWIRWKKIDLEGIEGLRRENLLPSGCTRIDRSKTDTRGKTLEELEVSALSNFFRAACCRQVMDRRSSITECSRDRRAALSKHSLSVEGLEHAGIQGAGQASSAIDTGGRTVLSRPGVISRWSPRHLRSAQNSMTGRVPVGLADTARRLSRLVVGPLCRRPKLSQGFADRFNIGARLNRKVLDNEVFLDLVDWYFLRTPKDYPDFPPLKGLLIPERNYALARIGISIICAPSAQLGPPILVLNEHRVVVSATRVGVGAVTPCHLGCFSRPRAAVLPAIAYRPCGLQQAGRSPPANRRGLREACLVYLCSGSTAPDRGETRVIGRVTIRGRIPSRGRAPDGRASATVLTPSVAYSRSISGSVTTT